MSIENFVYLARPVDRSGKHSGTIDRWMYHIRDAIIEYNRNAVIFDAGGGCYCFGNDSEIKTAVALRAVNEMILGSASFAVILYLTFVPTVGVITEIDLCKKLGIPMVIITDETPSFYILSMLNNNRQVVWVTEAKGGKNLQDEINADLLHCALNSATNQEEDDD